MRYLFLLQLWSVLLPAWSQPVLTITDNRKASPVAPFAYYFEDLSQKLTYEQVRSLPLDSFQPIYRQGAIQLGIRLGTVWLRLQVQNQTGAELFLLSSMWKYERMDVYLVDQNGQVTLTHSEAKMPFAHRLAPIAQPIVSIGHQPRVVHLALSVAPDFFNDYLQVTTMGEAMRYQKKTTFWQGGLSGVYLLTFLFALVFFLRLRDPLIGWYALFVFINTNWFLDRSGYLMEFLGQDSWYSHIRPYYPMHLIFIALWSIFLIKFIHLWEYSRFLYVLIIAWISLDFIDYLVFIFRSVTGLYDGQYYGPLRILLHWIGIEYVGYLAINNCLLLISIIYVSLKDFKKVRWYALAFGIGLISMNIAIVALFDISWLPYYPFNNFYFIGSLVEIIMLGFVLAERASQHRKEQNEIQHQLIVQLQQNLLQRDKLLRIRDEIARDLHDEVGATLTSIAISTKLVQKKVGLEQTDIEPILAQIKADSEDTIHSIRDTVWALNPDNDAPEKFLERLRIVAYQMLTNGGIALTFDTKGKVETLPPFSMEQRRNLYLVYKETLQNILKHAGASIVSIQIGHSEGLLQITISDNGQGFDTATHAEGNGLINFKKRAREGGFTVGVQSQAGSGTTISIKVPIQMNDSVAIHPLMGL